LLFNPRAATFFNIENLVLRASSELDGFAGKDCEVFWSIGVLERCKISNSKHQITNKSQIPILNDQNKFGPPQADWSLLFV
jgi:hypothetical protein